VTDFLATAATRQEAEAEKDWLTNHLPTATHAHLACQGRHQYLSDQGPVPYLAQKELVDTAYRERLTPTRGMVVFSGCDSAHDDTMGVPDESLTTGFLQAGAASVSSLWQVDDTATALLIPDPPG
jgi:CHAT domain-containing protein